ncbi:hypothetical protein IWT25_00772 [Secundilactobacillus pentosiphilus]|uniref:Cyanophage baseplate Pam3 plug gp18 domain-containing protein n=1 Tax=Secundilactobacillus pentosiphilus TaxID=1714682 RepID=A0A1Z5IUV8_9LACO|nr:hypothetical protein [Secundilactobacillus pentosiphilus]GAX05466.1 hypothetical protein IWT25_00772 [Secundilactobacillus pentosiphilus]
MAQYDTIPCDPNQLPYEYTIIFDGKAYTLGFQYNEFSDQITVSISDDDGLIAREPLVLKQPIFQAVHYKDRLPLIELMPIDESGNEIEVNIDNLNLTVEIADTSTDLTDVGDDDG